MGSCCSKGKRSHTRHSTDGEARSRKSVTRGHSLPLDISPQSPHATRNSLSRTPSNSHRQVVVKSPSTPQARVDPAATALPKKPQLSKSMSLTPGSHPQSSPPKTRLDRRHTVQPPSMRNAGRDGSRPGATGFPLNSSTRGTLAFAVDYIGCDTEIPFRLGFLPTDDSTIGALERQYAQRKPPYRQVILVINEERLTIYDSHDFNQVVHRLPLLSIVQVDARHDTITVCEDTRPGVRSCHVMRCRLANQSHTIVSVISRVFHRAFTDYSMSARAQQSVVSGVAAATDETGQEKPSRAVSLVDVFNVHRELLVTPDDEHRSLAFEREQGASSEEQPSRKVSETGSSATLVARDQPSYVPQQAALARGSMTPLSEDAADRSPAAAAAAAPREFSRDVYRHSIRVRRPGLRESETTIKAIDVVASAAAVTSSSPSPAPSSSSGGGSAMSEERNYLEMTYDELLDSVSMVMGTPVQYLRLCHRAGVTDATCTSSSTCTSRSMGVQVTSGISG